MIRAKQMHQNERKVFLRLIKACLFLFKYKKKERKKGAVRFICCCQKKQHHILVAILIKLEADSFKFLLYCFFFCYCIWLDHFQMKWKKAGFIYSFFSIYWEIELAFCGCTPHSFVHSFIHSLSSIYLLCLAGASWIRLLINIKL